MVPLGFSVVQFSLSCQLSITFKGPFFLTFRGGMHVAFSLLLLAFEHNNLRRLSLYIIAVLNEKNVQDLICVYLPLWFGAILSSTAC